MDKTYLGYLTTKRRKVMKTTENKNTNKHYTKEYSVIKTHKLDRKIEEAVRKVYGYGEEGDEVMMHYAYTISDAKSYFGYNDEYREETMYSGDFEYRNEAE